MPWFRGNWALAGEPLVNSAEAILYNAAFIEAARTAFSASAIRPKTVVVNVNGPMPAGAPHVDVPSFRGAARDHFPLRFLLAMGASELFARWQVTEAGAISWFYEGLGGGFDYWPDGRDGPMLCEQSPFGNVAIIADNDRMYHRIGRIGDADAVLPKMTKAAVVHPSDAGDWIVTEDGETRTTYAKSVMRLSILWKAEIITEDRPTEAENALHLDRIMEIFKSDLRAKRIQHEEPADPFTDDAWITLLEGTYLRSFAR